MIFNAYKSKRSLVKPADYTSKTTPIESSTGTWKATKDCWVRVNLMYSTSGNKRTSLYINDKLFVECSLHGFDVNYPGIYIRKGDELKITGYMGTLTVYFCR